MSWRHKGTEKARNSETHNACKPPALQKNLAIEYTASAVFNYETALIIMRNLTNADDSHESEVDLNLYQLDFSLQVDSGAAQDRRNLTIVQPRSIVFHSDSALFFVKLDFADAINFPGIIQGSHLFFARGRV